VEIGIIKYYKYIHESYNNVLCLTVCMCSWWVYVSSDGCAGSG